jgi:protein-tyrosine phosphatase
VPDPCRNFRDVGEWLALLAGTTILPPGRLLRGGKLDAVRSPAEIGSPGTIVNLRVGPDRDHFAAEPRQVAIPNAIEKYDTADREVRRWLNNVAAAVADAPRLPILLHCTSGKDRTGVAVAVLLLALDVPRALVIEEFLLSDDVTRTDIDRALDGIGDVARFLDRVDLQRLRARLLG